MRKMNEKNRSNKEKNSFLIVIINNFFEKKNKKDSGHFNQCDRYCRFCEQRKRH